MSASTISPYGGHFIEPTEDLSSDPITVAMLRMYRDSSPAWRRAFSRMLERIVDEGMPMEEAMRRFGVAVGMTDAEARRNAAKAMSRIERTVEADPQLIDVAAAAIVQTGYVRNFGPPSGGPFYGPRRHGRLMRRRPERTPRGRVTEDAPVFSPRPSGRLRAAHLFRGCAAISRSFPKPHGKSMLARRAEALRASCLVIRQDWKQDWKRMIVAAVIVAMALGGAVSALWDSQRETVAQTGQADFPS
jgi:hypothetical protein